MGESNGVVEGKYKKDKSESKAAIIYLSRKIISRRLDACSTAGQASSRPKLFWIAISGPLILVIFFILIGRSRSVCLAADGADGTYGVDGSNRTAGSNGSNRTAGAAGTAGADGAAGMIHFRGHVRANFSQYNYTGGGKSSWQSGMRCDLESTKFLVEGLGMETDFRYRHYNSQWRSSLKSLYELAIFYRPSYQDQGQVQGGKGQDHVQDGLGQGQGQGGQGIYFKLGRFNLYDLSGVGELDGGAAGWSFSKNFLTGLYLGCEPNLAEIKTNPDYHKGGLFLNYRGLNGLSAIFSCNHIRFKGLSERTFLYGQAFLPIWKRIYSYQHIEYELGPQAKSRLTRLFINTRLDLSNSISTTGSYYYGQGYDYHQMVLEKLKSGQTPTTEDLEQFYWYEDLGLRLSLKVGQRQRISGHASLARKKRDGDILPRYGVSYFIDDLFGSLLGDLLGGLLGGGSRHGMVGGGVRFMRTVEIQTIRNMLSLDVDADLNDRLTLGLSYTNYTFEFVEQGSTIVSPPDSREYNMNFSVRLNRQFQVYGFIQYSAENVNAGSYNAANANCWQNYLSLVYRL